MQEIAKRAACMFFRSAKDRKRLFDYARVKQSMIASSKIACTVPGIRRTDNHENYTQSQCAQYSTVKIALTVRGIIRTGDHALFNTRAYGEH